MAIPGVLCPDTIVNDALRELSHEGVDGITFDKLWDLLSSSDLVIDDFYKKIIYSWLINNENIELLDDKGKVVAKKPVNYEDVCADKHYFVRVTSDYQYIVLTGSPKENNAIVGKAYSLLLEIAKHRSEGVDSKKLREATEQDARSLTQRINKLGNTVKKIPIVRGGRTLSLLILTEFYDPSKTANIAINSKSDEVTMNVEDTRYRFVNTLKSAKHSIRQIADLRREMEMDKTPKLKRLFLSCMRYLAAKNYIDRVYVISPAHPKRQFLALKYITDYVRKEGDRDDHEDDNDDDDDLEFNDELIDDELKELENEAPTSLASVDNLQITSSEESINFRLFNRVFPFQNQAYQIVKDADTTGVSSTDILDSMFGRSYSRLFSRMMESYTPETLVPHIANHGIVRHYDFKGRTKFYRYLTKPNFLKFSNQPEDVNGSSLLPFVPAAPSLELLDKSNFIPMNNTVSLLEQGNETTIHWFGQGGEITAEERAMMKSQSKKTTVNRGINDNSDPASSTKRKRGRPKKGEEVDSQGKKQKTGEETTAQNTISVEEEKVRPDSLTDKTDEQKTDTVSQYHEKDKNSTESEKASKKSGKASSRKAGTSKEETTESSNSEGKSEKKDTAVSDKPPSKTITVSNLAITSFKALERLNVILEVMEQNGGVLEYNFTFAEAVRNELNYTVDKKTIQRDVESLVRQGKLYLRELEVDQPRVDQLTTKRAENVDDPDKKKKMTPRLVALIDTPTSVVDAFKEQIKSRAKAAKAQPKISQVQNVDIEFYDNELRKSFTEAREKVVQPLPKKPRLSKNAAATRKNVEALQQEADKLPPKSIPKSKIKAKSADTAKSGLRASKKLIASADGNHGAGMIKKEHMDDEWDAVPKKERKPHSTRKKRNASHLNSTETILLFKAVIICKTINENQIHWEKITNLFNGISQDVLRKKWPRIRLLMGPEGGKIARRTWKRVLLASIREGKISLPEVEELDLDSLVKLWQDAEILGLPEETSESLFANYEENFTQYNFVKNSTTSQAALYDSNSMIQREQYLVNKSFTYSAEGEGEDKLENIKDESGSDTKETIRKIIIAILASGEKLTTRKLPVLSQFAKEEVDEVFVEMTRKKEIFVNAESKVVLGETISHILDDNTYDFSIQKVNLLHNLLKELFEANRGFVLDPIFDNAFVVPIVELSARKQLDIVRVDHYRREVLYGYGARTIEREKLDCDVILTKGEIPVDELNGKSPLVPIGKPCSRIWINVEGKINKNLWNKVNRVVLMIILSQPGITKVHLFKKLSLLLNKSELEEILGWLSEANSISQKDFEGLWLRPCWYTVLGS